MFRQAKRYQERRQSRPRVKALPVPRPPLLLASFPKSPAPQVKALPAPRVKALPGPRVKALPGPCKDLVQAAQQRK